MKNRAISAILIVIFAFVGYYVYKSDRVSQVDSPRLAKYAFKLGLDLNGGTELTYKADVSQVKGDVSDAMSSLRDVIERRVNLFGVSEPVVQVENPGAITGQSDYRLLVGLPGVTDINKAVELIGKTPKLEFMLIRPEAQKLSQEELKNKKTEDIFMPVGLDGRLLSKADLQFTSSGNGQISGEPIVGLTFNSEGRDLFAKVKKITEEVWNHARAATVACTAVLQQSGIVSVSDMEAIYQHTDSLHERYSYSDTWYTDGAFRLLPDAAVQSSLSVIEGFKNDFREKFTELFFTRGSGFIAVIERIAQEHDVSLDDVYWYRKEEIYALIGENLRVHDDEIQDRKDCYVYIRFDDKCYSISGNAAIFFCFCT
jgi:preprotein translocase subunit SecD